MYFRILIKQKKTKKCAEIETVITDKKAQFETLVEYKKSLIYEYVTGNKEVLENEF
jgi:type I restriction enzyme S subunit